jgi:hypothetical protein
MRMKNKTAEQEKERMAHKERMRKTPSLNRSMPSIPKKKKILIVCEGENTEPSYFRQFRLATATVHPVGEGYNTESLVERAILLSRKDKYDEVWCVFDKDDFSNQNFNASIENARKSNLKVAYSNQAFEYWLLLHFEDHQGGPLHRNDYGDKINKYITPLGAYYDSDNSKLIDKNFFAILCGIDKRYAERRVDLAIKRARKIYERYTDDHPAVEKSLSVNPAKEESSTRVFLLVEEILKYI